MHMTTSWFWTFDSKDPFSSGTSHGGMSEIHAIDFSHSRFDSDDHASVHFRLRWDFIAKNQLPGQPDRQFHFPALSSIFGAEDTEVLSLCPVRALLFVTFIKKCFIKSFQNNNLLMNESSHTQSLQGSRFGPSISPHEVIPIASTLALPLHPNDYGKLFLKIATEDVSGIRTSVWTSSSCLATNGFF